MNDIVILGLVLLLVGIGAVAAIIGYYTVWKPRQRQRLERAHFRSKRSS